jgi:phosphoserine aminotransferase
MSRIFNFNAGPSTLPLDVLETAKDELLDYHGCGMSILEVSHRSQEYSQVHERAVDLVRELLGLPSGYTVLFLGGGATLQFAMVPMNLLGAGQSCDFTVSGAWSKKALADAQKVGKVNVVFDGKAGGFIDLPDPGSLKLDPQAAYLHLTSNETIGGVQWQDWPDAGKVPLICDMSSDIMSRPVPVERFGLIYAGAQKNIGPAGVSLVIIRDDLLKRCPDNLAAYLNYRTHADKGGLYNTPPVFAIHMVKLVLERLAEHGGLDAARELAEKRAGLLYDAIEGSGGFYRCPVDARFRSRMNVVFRLPEEQLEKDFIVRAAEQGMGGLKGHRSVGGCRASIYNAMPVEGVQKLVDFMREFASKNG